jgi:predicted transglutaminase-like cysteine proteinase
MRRGIHKYIRNTFVATFGAITVVAATLTVTAAAETSGRYAVIGAKTSVPYGWLDFCGRRPQECDVAPLPPVNVKLTAEAWSVLNQVNQRVNAFIIPVTNLEHWGTMLDHWDYPVDGKGDCKVYALYKRKLLMQAGFPRQALLMTIVRDLEGEGHVILTVRTDRGEFVLDNLAAEIRPWDVTGYQYIKRQSQEDPNIWLSIEAPKRPQAETRQVPAVAPAGSGRDILGSTERLTPSG